ncbi:TPA: WavQ [Escherichia coli]|nr:WavQ [Escherichia coli]
MDFIIVAPPFNINKGGALVLHKLCHLLNVMGHKASLFPYVSESNYSLLNKYQFLKGVINHRLGRFVTNPDFITPVITQINKVTDSSVVIYPEIVNGNPLRAKNVVRWFLHNPGFHTGNVKYGTREFYISYKTFGRNFSNQYSYMARTELTITHYLNDVYNTDSTISNELRTGSAYCMRKGKGRTIEHDLTNSYLIDGLSHHEIASIFKEVKYFFSYDLYTAYFWFAIMCGCIPVVIPNENVTKEEWYPNEEDRFGIAYGIDDIEYARKTRHLALQNFKQQENNNIKNVQSFIRELLLYLKNNSIDCKSGIK